MGIKLGTYDERYESSLLRGQEDPRPWDPLVEVEKYLNPSSVLLDLGCGTARKTVHLAPEVKKIIGIDSSSKMLAKANLNIQDAGVSNFQVVPGKSEEIPYPDSSFDLILCIMSPIDPKEAFRVLRPGGIVVAELIDNEDKQEIKDLAGSDSQGGRGWTDFYFESRSSIDLTNQFNELFASVDISNGVWNAYLTREGLQLLIEITKFIQRFDPLQDHKFLDLVEKNYSTGKGIKITHRRRLVIAKKF